MDYSLYIDKIEAEIGTLESAYHRLLLIVGRHETGKTRLVRALQEKLNLPMINLNLQVSKRLLDLTGRQRILNVPKILAELAHRDNCKPAIFDNTEILFDDNLKLDPLRLLQSISRNMTVVATWNGNVEKENLCYAEPSHPEYKRYPTHGLRIISLMGNEPCEGTEKR
jgi:hypothetical protein